MKETVIDVLMYLFQNYMDGELALDSDQESIQVELVEAGFPQAEISKAFDWLESLTALQADDPKNFRSPSQSIRMYTGAETSKLDTECRGFLILLEHVGVLNSIMRELVIDRVMALATDEISLEQLKWVVLMVLFTQPGQEAAIAWMEDHVFNNRDTRLH